MFSEKAKKKFLFYRFITHPSVFCPAILSCKRLPRLLLPPVRNDIYRPCMSRIHRPEWPTIRHKKGTASLTDCSVPRYLILSVILSSGKRAATKSVKVEK